MVYRGLRDIATIECSRVHEIPRSVRKNNLVSRVNFLPRCSLIRFATLELVTRWELTFYHPIQSCLEDEKFATFDGERLSHLSESTRIRAKCVSEDRDARERR